MAVAVNKVVILSFFVAPENWRCPPTARASSDAYLTGNGEGRLRLHRAPQGADVRNRQWQALPRRVGGRRQAHALEEFHRRHACLRRDIDDSGGRGVFTALQRGARSWWATFIQMDEADVAKARSVRRSAGSSSGGSSWSFFASSEAVKNLEAQAAAASAAKR